MKTNTLLVRYICPLFFVFLVGYLTSCKSENDLCETRDYAAPVLKLADSSHENIVVLPDSLYTIFFQAEAEAGLNIVYREHYQTFRVYLDGETEDSFSLKFMSWQNEQIQIFLDDNCNRSDMVTINVQVVDTLKESL